MSLRFQCRRDEQLPALSTARGALLCAVAWWMDGDRRRGDGRGIDARVADDGAVTLAVSGPDLLRELTYRSVGKLAIQSGGAAMTHTAAVAAAAAYAQAGWTVTAAGSPPCDSLYGQFAEQRACWRRWLRSTPRARRIFTRSAGR